MEGVFEMEFRGQGKSGSHLRIKASFTEKINVMQRPGSRDCILKCHEMKIFHKVASMNMTMHVTVHPLF